MKQLLRLKKKLQFQFYFLNVTRRRKTEGGIGVKAEIGILFLKKG